MRFFEFGGAFGVARFKARIPLSRCPSSYGRRLRGQESRRTQASRFPLHFASCSDERRRVNDTKNRPLYDPFMEITQNVPVVIGAKLVQK